MPYLLSGNYTDCFSVNMNGDVRLAYFINAFYTSKLFKLERILLKWLFDKPSTDEQVEQLAMGTVQKFSAWKVEKRTVDQLLLCDYQGRTRSWLMTEVYRVNDKPETRLYFGSAVIANSDLESSNFLWRIGTSLLFQFHIFYSQLLLAAAKYQLKNC